MNVEEVIQLALDNTHTTSEQVRADLLLRNFNISRKDVGNTIIKDVSENFFQDFWIRDAIADQNNGEYPYPEADVDSKGMLKCQALYVKYKYTDQNYIKAEEVNIADLPYDWDWYLVNQPKNQPIYFIGDNSFFLAPLHSAEDLCDINSENPDPSGNSMIKAVGLVKFVDLLITDEEDKMLIPEDFHDLIALGMEKGIYKSRGNRDEALLSSREYTIEKENMVDTLTNRDESKMIAKVPDEPGLEFGE